MKSIASPSGATKSPANLLALHLLLGLPPPPRTADTQRKADIKHKLPLSLGRGQQQEGAWQVNNPQQAEHQQQQQVGQLQSHAQFVLHGRVLFALNDMHKDAVGV